MARHVIIPLRELHASGTNDSRTSLMLDFLL